MGGILDSVHGGMVHQRRVHVLSRHLAELIPDNADVLDLGCGDGLIGSLVTRLRPDVRVTGMDIAVREDTHIPVQKFDGESIPVEDDGSGVVMLVDVLHHADDPKALLAEAARVASRAVVLKDSVVVGPFDDATLKFMDWVGNARHDVPLPYNFWTQAQWRETFADLGLAPQQVRRRFGLYPRPWGLVFERRMHFALRLVSRRKPAA